MAERLTSNGITMTEIGYNATRWNGPSHVRLRLTKRPILLTAAVHNDPFVGNVSLATPSRAAQSVCRFRAVARHARVTAMQATKQQQSGGWRGARKTPH